MISSFQFYQTLVLMFKQEASFLSIHVTVHTINISYKIHARFFTYATMSQHNTFIFIAHKMPGTGDVTIMCFVWQPCIMFYTLSHVYFLISLLFYIITISPLFYTLPNTYCCALYCHHTSIIYHNNGLVSDGRRIAKLFFIS